MRFRNFYILVLLYSKCFAFDQLIIKREETIKNPEMPKQHMAEYTNELREKPVYFHEDFPHHEICLELGFDDTIALNEKTKVEITSQKYLLKRNPLIFKDKEKDNYSLARVSLTKSANYISKIRCVEYHKESKKTYYNNIFRKELLRIEALVLKNPNIKLSSYLFFLAVKTAPHIDIGISYLNEKISLENQVAKHSLVELLNLGGREDLANLLDGFMRDYLIKLQSQN